MKRAHAAQSPSVSKSSFFTDGFRVLAYTYFVVRGSAVPLFRYTNNNSMQAVLLPAVGYGPWKTANVQEQLNTCLLNAGYSTLR